MSDCTFSQQISAYHDGELSPAVRAQVEAHLLECVPCRQELEALRAMSALFISAKNDMPGLAQISRERIKLAYRRDKGVLWLVEAVGGLAAALLITGSLWLVSHPTTSSYTPVATGDTDVLNVWVMRTMTDAPASDSDLQLAQLIVADLSQSARQQESGR